MRSDTGNPFETHLADYFHQRLASAQSPQQPRAQDDVVWYLSRMLARFGLSRHLYSYEEGQWSLRPLALLYQDARCAGSHWERCAMLRKLGDTALFMGALFPESYQRRGLQADYFAGMGRNAYDYLGDNDQRNPGLFRRLAAGFGQLQQLVAQACEKEQLFDATDLLQVYQRWQATGNPLLARQLMRAGWFLGQGRA